MQVVTGKSILGGIAIGTLRFYKRSDTQVAQLSALPAGEEWARFLSACAKAREALSDLYEKALSQVGEENAAIFEIHQMLLEDEDFRDAVKAMIDEQGVTAEYAALTAGEQFAEMFAAMEDDYMRARAVDIRDVSRRLTDILAGHSCDTPECGSPFILVADDLTPSETIQLDKKMLLGFVTRCGSANSHTAILARTMNIPALVGVDICESWNGKLGVLNGYGHSLCIEPTADILSAAEEKQKSGLRQRAMLQTLRGQSSETLDGKKISLYANIGSVEEAELALQNDAEGIGLFRSEFLYLDSVDYPTEEQQFRAYKQVVKLMAGRKVIIRTLDIGADKQAGYFGLDKEENPALGYRAIRICLSRKDIFKTQLRAILRASAFGMISVMFPMIISVQEVRVAKAILEECRAELEQQREAVGKVEIGIMIETPAAVMIADELATEVDFFSVGTNDLTQYTLAIDRQNQKLDSFYDPHHPAILRMIQHTVEAGHRHGCWVGICGELGADVALTEEFLRMGIDELSVSPSAVLPLRKIIRHLDLSKRT